MEFSLAIKLECVNIFLSSTDTKQKVTVIIIMSTIKRNVFELSFLLSTSAMFSQRLPPEKPGASIGGKVLTPAGKPVALARVRAVRTSPTRWTSPAVRSKSDGTFQISGLDVGGYSVCAEAPERFSLVDPCIWLGEPGQKSTALAGTGVEEYWLTIGSQPKRSRSVLFLQSSPKPKYC